LARLSFSNPRKPMYQSTSNPEAAEPRPKSESLKRLYQSLPPMLLILLLVVSGLEVGLRLVHISFPDFGVPDPDLGWALRPGTQGTVHFEYPTGVYVRINSDGMRDSEHAIAKPPHTLRIAVLGNSYSEAFPVPQDQAYWAVMQRALARCSLFGIQNVEVLNFGVGGYGTAQDLIVLRKKVWKYQPDLVLLAFLGSNDVWYNLRELNQQPSPYFVYQQDQLVLDNSFRKQLPSGRLKTIQIALHDHSRIVQVVTEIRRAYRQWVFTMMQGLQMAGTGNAAAAANADNVEEVRPTDTVFVAPRDKIWQDAWRVTEGIISLMHQEVQAHGAQLWIATLTKGIQIHPHPEARRAFAARLGAGDLLYADRRIQALAERENIPDIVLAIPLAEYAEQHQVFLHGFPGTIGQGHWNPEGNREAGELIAAKICGSLRSAP
jgi:hypothetical protein